MTMTKLFTKQIEYHTPKSLRHWAKSTPELKAILDNYENDKPLISVLEMIWDSNNLQHHKIMKLTKLVEEFDRLSHKGIFGKNTYSLRNEFFEELKTFREDHGDIFGKALEEKSMVEAGTQLSFDDYLGDLKIKEDFEMIIEKAPIEGIFGDVGQQQENNIRELLFAFYKQGRSDSE